MSSEYYEYASTESSTGSSVEPSTESSRESSPYYVNYRGRRKRDNLFLILLIISLSILFEPCGYIFLVIFLFTKPRLAAIAFATTLCAHFIPWLNNQ